MYTFTCKDCGVQLYLDANIVSKNGKRIPLSVGTQNPHNCPNRKYTTPCRNCSEPIYFDELILSVRGKKIPLNASNGEAHNCMGKLISMK